MKIALCLLTRNELACLHIIFSRLPKPGPDSGFDEIVAVDGGSTDGTTRFFENHGIRVVAQSRRGRGDAFLQAFDKVDADAYIFFSPDGNEDPADLPRFRGYLEQGYDLVIASRMMKGAVNEEDSRFFRWRKWANHGLNFLANLFFNRSGRYVTDSINGYRAISREAARKLSLCSLDYTIEYQMTIRAFKHRLKIVEFPTKEGERVAGETGAPSIPTGIRFVRRLLSEI